MSEFVFGRFHGRGSQVDPVTWARAIARCCLAEDLYLQMGPAIVQPCVREMLGDARGDLRPFMITAAPHCDTAAELFDYDPDEADVSRQPGHRTCGALAAAFASLFRDGLVTGADLYLCVGSGGADEFVPLDATPDSLGRLLLERLAPFYDLPALRINISPAR